MNAALTLSFESHEIRVLDQTRGRMVPVNDIADAVGRHRTSIRKLVSSDELLSEWSGSAVTASPSGNQESLCLTEPGVVRLLGMLNPERSATPESRAKVLAFGRWAATTLVKVMRGESTQVETWIGLREAARRLGTTPGALKGRIVKHHLPTRQGRAPGQAQDQLLVLFEACAAHVAAHPIQRIARVSHREVEEGLQFTSSILAELRRIYGPQGTQAVLHRMSPSLFPHPKTLPGGFQPSLEARP